MSARRLAIVTEISSPAGRSATRVRIGERELAPEVVHPLGRDSQVGAHRGDPVGLREPGAGFPAGAQLLLLIDERQDLALVGLRLDPADLIGAGLVVEQQDDQALDPRQVFVSRRSGAAAARAINSATDQRRRGLPDADVSPPDRVRFADRPFACSVAALRRASPPGRPNMLRTPFSEMKSPARKRDLLDSLFITMLLWLTADRASRSRCLALTVWVMRAPGWG
jgi:hypothetical protein